MTQSASKRNTKSRSYPGMKLVPVRVFSCKHPLSVALVSCKQIQRQITENLESHGIEFLVMESHGKLKLYLVARLVSVDEKARTIYIVHVHVR